MKKLVLMLIICLWFESAWATDFIKVYDHTCTGIVKYPATNGIHALNDALNNAEANDCVVICEDLTGAAEQEEQSQVRRNVKITTHDGTLHTVTAKSTSDVNVLLVYETSADFPLTSVIIENVAFIGSIGSTTKYAVRVLSPSRNLNISFTGCTFSMPLVTSATWATVFIYELTYSINATFTNCVINSPTYASGTGAGMIGLNYSNPGILTLSNCFINHDVYKTGAAISAATGNTIISGCYFYLSQSLEGAVSQRSNAIAQNTGTLLLTNNVVEFHKPDASTPKAAYTFLTPNGATYTMVGNLFFNAHKTTSSVILMPGTGTEPAINTNLIYNNTFVNIENPFFVDEYDYVADVSGSKYRNNIFYDCGYVVANDAGGTITEDGYIWYSLAGIPNNHLPLHANVTNNIFYRATDGPPILSNMTGHEVSPDESWAVNQATLNDYEDDTTYGYASHLWHTNPALNGATISTCFPDAGSTAKAKTGGKVLNATLGHTNYSPSTKLLSRQAKLNADPASMNLSTIDQLGHSLTTFPIGAYSYGMFDYFVDQTGGLDTNAGTQTNPWKTISGTSPVASADNYDPAYAVNVKLKKGETWAETLTVPASGGSAVLPVTFTSYGSTGAKPIIDGVALGIDGNDKDYLVFNDLDVTLATTGGILLSGDNNTIQGCTVRDSIGAGDYGILASGATNTITKNYITGNGIGVQISGADNIVSYNKIADNPFGVEMKNTGTVVAYNLITGSTTFGIDLNAGVDVGSIYNNTIVGTDVSGINIYNTAPDGTIGSLKNNIIKSGSAIAIEGTGAITSMTNNCIWNSADTLGAAISAIASSGNLEKVDPKFKSTTEFYLKSGSPCLKKGATLASPYDYGLSKSSTWPSSVVTKKQDSKFTIGAYAMKKSCLPGSRILCTLK